MMCFRGLNVRPVRNGSRLMKYEINTYEIPQINNKRIKLVFCCITKDSQTGSNNKSNKTALVNMG
jgi:hypothetical protein